jgi:hypothetical protein
LRSKKKQGRAERIALGLVWGTFSREGSAFGEAGRGFFFFLDGQGEFVGLSLCRFGLLVCWFGLLVGSAVDWMELD